MGGKVSPQGKCLVTPDDGGDSNNNGRPNGGGNNKGRPNGDGGNNNGRPNGKGGDGNDGGDPSSPENVRGLGIGSLVFRVNHLFFESERVKEPFALWKEWIALFTLLKRGMRAIRCF